MTGHSELPLHHYLCRHKGSWRGDSRCGAGLFGIQNIGTLEQSRTADGLQTDGFADLRMIHQILQFGQIPVSYRSE